MIRYTSESAERLTIKLLPETKYHFFKYLVLSVSYRLKKFKILKFSVVQKAIFSQRVGVKVVPGRYCVLGALQYCTLSS